MRQLSLFDDAGDDGGDEGETQRARTIYERLHDGSRDWERTAVQETRDHRDPFRTLIASMLSARTKEEDTRQATQALFARAATPAEMARLPPEEIAAAIRPVTYHENKVRYVQEIARRVHANGDQVPRTVAELTAYPGVGWKTAVLTLWIAYGIAEEICVDVHGARIGRRLGFVNPKTRDPRKVSRELMAVVPRELWGPWNPMMVRFGRTVCFPDRPNCPQCPIRDLCPQIGVTPRRG